MKQYAYLFDTKTDGCDNYTAEYFRSFTWKELSEAYLHKGGLTRKTETVSRILCRGEPNAKERRILEEIYVEKKNQSDIPRGSFVEGLVQKNIEFTAVEEDGKVFVEYDKSGPQKKEITLYPEEQQTYKSLGITVAPFISFGIIEKGRAGLDMLRWAKQREKRYQFLDMGDMLEYIGKIQSFINSELEKEKCDKTYTGKEFLGEVLRIFSKAERPLYGEFANLYVKLVMHKMFKWSKSGTIVGMSELWKKHGSKDLDVNDFVVRQERPDKSLIYFPKRALYGSGSHSKEYTDFFVACQVLEKSRMIRGKDEKGAGVNSAGAFLFANIGRSLRKVVRFLSVVWGVLLTTKSKGVFIVGAKLGGVLPALGASLTKWPTPKAVYFRPEGTVIPKYPAITGSFDCPEDCVPIVFHNATVPHAENLTQFQELVEEQLQGILSNYSSKNPIIVTKALSEAMYQKYDVYALDSFHAADAVLVPKGTDFAMASRNKGETPSRLPSKQLDSKSALALMWMHNRMKDDAWLRPMVGKCMSINLVVPVKLTVQLWSLMDAEDKDLYTCVVDEEPEYLDEDSDEDPEEEESLERRIREAVPPSRRRREPKVPSERVSDDRAPQPQAPSQTNVNEQSDEESDEAAAQGELDPDGSNL